MVKNTHEIRDAIHTFIQFDSHERKIISTHAPSSVSVTCQPDWPLTHLVYPGATHKRFEHSLGVMELADRIFRVVTEPENVNDAVRRVLPELRRPDELRYWRKVVSGSSSCAMT